MSSGRNRANDVELNLMDEEGDHEILDIEDPDAAEESAFAVQEFTRLPSGSQEQVRNVLRNSEKLQFVEKPSRWRSTLFLLQSDLAEVLFKLFLKQPSP